MKKLSVICILTLFVSLLIITKTAFACGTMEDWVNAYYGKGHIRNMNKKEALIGIVHAGCAASYYKGRNSDRIILPVIMHAIINRKYIDMLDVTFPMFVNDGKYKDRSAKSLISEIYYKYNCLQGASDMAGYDDVAELLGTASCPGQNKEKNDSN